MKTQRSLFDEPDTTPQFQSLPEVIDHMMQMTDDPLYPMGTNMVIHRGNPKTKLMIVGEAPGPQENIQGKPFVGKAGQMLDRILAAVKLDSNEDVYMTNSVFRLPPGEMGKSFRKPTKEEIAYYRPYVSEIIRLVDPKIILLTGGVAVQSVLGETKLGITKMRGAWHEVDGRWIMPMFHPSYLLRNQSRQPGSPKALTWADIQEVRRKYDELELGQFS
ncbi:MAG: uracil-DNA glycosylase [Chloroflexota bacterium]